MDYRLFSEMMLKIDPFLIFFFRLTGVALMDFFVGIFALAMMCVVIGEFTLSLALRFNRDHLKMMQKDILHQEHLSLQAYQMKDRTGYKALNRAANDAWGKHFFTMAAYSAGMLWPAPFALAWLNTRFEAVAFDLSAPLSLAFGNTVRYPFIFILAYMLCRLLFKYLRPFLPYFKQVQKMLDDKKPQSSLY